MDPTKIGFNLMDGEKKMSPPPSYVASIPRRGNAATAQGRGNGAAIAIEPPPGFYVKKWILLVNLFLEIASVFVVFFCLDYIVEIVVNNLIDPNNKEEMIKIVAEYKTDLLVYMIFNFLLWLLFTYGISEHHLGLTIVYTVLNILVTIVMIICCFFIVSPVFILSTLGSAIITGISYSYMKDLFKMRENYARMGRNVI